ncbi:MAG: manganese efflux pump [Clostridia bacterium]|nr:manganese efflux pump [Clostridia bacterium]
MSILEIGLIGLGLAMDAFAVSVCKGLSMKKFDVKKMIIIGLYFGLFQFLMPVIGYFLGNSFEEIVKSVDHWIAFTLLGLIGMSMIKDSFDDEVEKRNDKIDFKTMLFLAIATSIDALAVGITFAFYHVNLLISSSFIGVITFALSSIGVRLGFQFGDKFQNKAELVGGMILILIGFKILLEDLGVISFHLIK